ncbi:type II toxin-antitoxin system ParD family antitoxin [Mesorhizobium sp. LHD-90]|uniref:type II toxin-antitoxin system ParD family antitoxin n=1 Tax=Mesorhizobium sp. LHD-90 TaxID=3071414 RepID=UPI0027DF3C82|nr:type II toxin-antitoxin system ParD family antitoxin [Mesorhizobium sp. LHD-90]MDQ6437329.1 type II toxin-antitoxin system ParD family antitoxin [Mesorhizobium sp. LHD-90]
MNKRTTISLDTPFSEFVEQQVEDGHYASPDEVVQAGLRLLEEQESYIEAVRAALIEGENSGPPEPFDFDEFIARKKARQ